MRVLVTGGAGFIGSHVVDRLVALGHEVTVLDNLDPQVHGENATPRNIQGHIDARTVHFILADVRDQLEVENALRVTDCVIHLAAAVGVGQSMYKPTYYTDVNVNGTGVILEALARDRYDIQRLVVASSMSLYGEGAYVCHEHGPQMAGVRRDADMRTGNFEHACPVCGGVLAPVATSENHPSKPDSIYAVTKKTQEEMALAFGKAYDIPTTALRFFNAYGPRQSLSNPYTGVAAIFLSRLMNDQAPMIFEDGEQARDFIHVSDIAEAVVRCAVGDTPVVGAYNVCTGRMTTVRQIADTLQAILGSDVAPETLGNYRSGDIRHCYGDGRALEEATGFKAQVQLEDGLRELAEWCRTEQAEDKLETCYQELQEHGLVR